MIFLFLFGLVGLADGAHNNMNSVVWLHAYRCAYSFWFRFVHSTVVQLSLYFEVMEYLTFPWMSFSICVYEFSDKLFAM